MGSLAAVCSRSMASKLDSLDWEPWAIQWQKNLMKHGYPLILYDVSPAIYKKCKEAGEQVASSPANVAEKMSLPSSMNSVEVYSGANGILKRK